ncbi:MAG: hypothetical protein J5715_08730 [Clostridiales bacterium]|nr:hypothetical protein [Clostridiales bacterium]
MSKGKLILWVLGWIFCFPIPVTILVLRHGEWETKLKIGIIAGAWVIFLTLMLGIRIGSLASGGRRAETTTTEAAVTTTTEAPTTTTTEATTTTTTTEATSEEEDEDETSETEEEGLSADDIKKAIEDGDYSLVTPEFKKTMDSYEEFYDEYIKFMKKYTSGKGDLTKMMKDYDKLIKKEEKWIDKMGKIDVSELSVADSAYYLLVTARVEGKLAKYSFGL